MADELRKRMAKERVADIDDLARGELKRVDVQGVPVCLVHAEDGCVYAINDLCTHEEAWLSDGWVSGVEIECPAHNSAFDLRTGEPTALPAVDRAQTYAVSVEGSDIFVEVDTRDTA